MSDQKNVNPKNTNPDAKKNKDAMVKHQKKVENFKLDLDDQKINSDLHMEGKELRSHTDGKTGPVPPEKFQRAEKQAAPGRDSEQLKSPEQRIKEHKKRSRKKGRKNSWFFRGVWLAAIVLIGVGIAQFAISCLNDMLAFQKEKTEVTIELQKGATTEQIADILKQNHIIENPWAFTVYSKFTKSDGNYEFGTFTLSTDMDYQALINTLQESSSRVDTVKITFQEGMQITEMAAELERQGVCTADDFLKAVNDESLSSSFEFVDDIKNKEGRVYFLEGYLFPDTYDFYKNEGVANVLEKLLTNTNEKLTNSLYKKAEKADMSMDEVITMASMIQAEAADKTDMLNISSVFHNRLKAGGNSGFAYLNSDPTIWYPYPSEKEMPEGFQGDYNTYTHVGLPVGAICNPGLSAIEAALEPAETNYYYFCHSKTDGTPYYAETEEEHYNNQVAAGIIS